MTSFLARYLEVPSSLQKELYRIYYLGLYIYPLACLFHFFFIFLFAWLGVEILAWFNMGSVSVWLLGLWLHRRRYIFFSAAIAYIEIAAHAGLAVSLFGMASGFYYYIFAACLGVFLYPIKRFYLFVMAIISAAIIVALYIYLSAHPPTPPIPERIVVYLGIMNIFIMVSIVSLLAYYYATAARSAETALAAAHERSESLLHNILPEKIADRLKTDKKTIADRFDEATVLFADIVDFTPLSGKTPPENVVKTLNRIFSAIDDLAAEHGLEKIKTIGDAYMVAAGIPEPRADHPEAVADFALDLAMVVEQYSIKNNQSTQMRIGINSGPVIAGVIGKWKFSYDVWGDCVNTAARMESHGMPGEIQLTQSTRDLLGDNYIIEERGVIEVKGKGPMKTYFLKGKRKS